MPRSHALRSRGGYVQAIHARRLQRSDLSKAGPELVGRDVLALFEAVVDRLGDDFGLLAGDAPGGELLGDGEGVEHARSA